MPSIERGRACASDCARLPPAFPRATCSSVFLQTRGCPCNSSFGGFPGLSVFLVASNLALSIVGGSVLRPYKKIRLFPVCDWFGTPRPHEVNRHAQKHDHQ